MATSAYTSDTPAALPSAGLLLHHGPPYTPEEHGSDQCGDFFVRYPLTVQGGERVHVQGLRDELVNLFEFIMLST